MPSRLPPLPPLRAVGISSPVDNLDLNPALFFQDIPPDIYEGVYARVAVETIMEDAGENADKDPTFKDIIASLVGDSSSMETAVRVAYLYGWRQEKVISWGDRFFR